MSSFNHEEQNQLLYQLNIPGSVSTERILFNMEKQEFTGEKNISKFIAQTFGFWFA